MKAFKTAFPKLLHVTFLDAGQIKASRGQIIWGSCVYDVLFLRVSQSACEKSCREETCLTLLTQGPPII